MYVGSISVDFNGIVLFDPDGLNRLFGPIAEGTDLFTRFITTEEGDEVLKRGLIVPVLAIDDGEYEVVVRLPNEESPVRGSILVENGIFPFRVDRRAVLADLAVLKEWIPEMGWTNVPVPKGSYAVTIRGYTQLDPLKGEIANAGYEFVLAPVMQLPVVSGETGKNMRVLRLE